jgi:hypothetical protein
LGIVDRNSRAQHKQKQQMTRSEKKMKKDMSAKKIDEKYGATANPPQTHFGTPSLDHQREDRATHIT